MCYRRGITYLLILKGYHKKLIWLHPKLFMLIFPQQMFKESLMWPSMGSCADFVSYLFIIQLGWVIILPQSWVLDARLLSSIYLFGMIMFWLHFISRTLI